MANYIARTELHSATWDDYEKLHASMQRRGYSRTIKGDNGVTYQLPTGTYVAVNTNVTLGTALDAAVEAAGETGRSSSVIVTDWTSAQWKGLPKA
ncbi:MAG: hypothetical protein ABSG53_23610 [Thermoguttaceae bacterium]